MTQKHTPTPWVWIEGDPDIFTLWNNKEVPLAAVKSPIWHEDRLCGSLEAAANAAHIVKCVNMHDELVEALEIAETYKLKQEDRLIIEKTLKKAGAL